MFRAGLLALLFCTFSTLASPLPLPETEIPEQDEIAALIEQSTPPEGILFVFADHDEEALNWFLPRLLHYVRQLRARYPQLPLAVVSHGDEMMALKTATLEHYPDIAQWMNELDRQQVVFHVCGAFAAMAGIDESEFTDSVDVVPFGPDQINDYRLLGFEVVSLEPTW